MGDGDEKLHWPDSNIQFGHQTCCGEIAEFVSIAPTIEDLTCDSCRRLVGLSELKLNKRPIEKCICCRTERLPVADFAAPVCAMCCDIVYGTPRARVKSFSDMVDRIEDHFRSVYARAPMPNFAIIVFLMKMQYESEDFLGNLLDCIDSHFDCNSSVLPKYMPKEFEHQRPMLLTSHGVIGADMLVKTPLYKLNRYINWRYDTNK